MCDKRQKNQLQIARAFTGEGRSEGLKARREGTEALTAELVARAIYGQRAPGLRAAVDGGQQLSLSGEADISLTLGCWACERPERTQYIMTKRAIFLDRDGVINRDTGYVYKPGDFEFIDGIFELAAAAQAVGYELIVVTNQAGVARGYYSESDVQRAHKWLQQQFGDRGITVARIYYCPFHPEGTVGQYRADSPHRKPNPGMILQAAKERGIDLSSSILIGDKESDLEAGRRAKVGTVVLFDPNSDPVLTALQNGYKIGSLRELAKQFSSSKFPVSTSNSSE